MPDKKLTDNEIVKALERLKNTKDYLKEQYQEQVKKCPYPELKPIAKQTYEDNKKAFDIAIKAIEEINRLQAEIKRLENTLDDVLDREPILVERSEKYAKAEAYKEFAERLRFEIVNKPSEFKASQATVDFLSGHAHRHHKILDILDNLLKELAGEDQ